jgi:hypothetical protein
VTNEFSIEASLGSEAEFRAAHKKYLDACEPGDKVSREALLEYGRAVVRELTRRQGIVRACHDDNDQWIKLLLRRHDAISEVLGLIRYDT